VPAAIAGAVPATNKQVEAAISQRRDFDIFTSMCLFGDIVWWLYRQPAPFVLLLLDAAKIA
jgi:hypothetical protein